MMQQFSSNSYNDPLMSQPPMGMNDPMRSNSFFGGRDEPSIVQLQLDCKSLLEDIEHFLRGDTVSFDPKTKSTAWTRPSKDKEIFNEVGVNDILNFLISYLNVNTLLSNYSEEQINYKMFGLVSELNDMIYMRYDVYGLDTDEKRKLYPVTVTKIKDMVNSAYLRALGGKERESLRKQFMISGSLDFPHGGGGYGGGYGNGTGLDSERRSMFNPMNWFKKSNKGG